MTRNQQLEGVEMVIWTLFFAKQAQKEAKKLRDAGLKPLGYYYW